MLPRSPVVGKRPNNARQNGELKDEGTARDSIRRLLNYFSINYFSIAIFMLRKYTSDPSH
jgi:hypothetical protein